MKPKLAWTWAGAPLLCLVLGFAMARAGQVPADGAASLILPASVDAAQKAELEEAVHASVANAAWAFGDGPTVMALMQREAERLATTGGPSQARALIRMALVDPNPDGHAALIGRACVVDPDPCSDIAAMKRRQAQERFVAPGNVEWLEMMKHHPRRSGTP